MSAHYFKVWSADRLQKQYVKASSVSDVIDKGCVKLGYESISDCFIVEERDGTLIKEDEILMEMKDQVLMILKPDEIWKSLSELNGASTAVINSSAGDALIAESASTSFRVIAAVLKSPDTAVASTSVQPSLSLMHNEDAKHEVGVDQNNSPTAGEDEDYCTALFIDDSNIFIEGQKFYAKHFNLIVPQDPCFRVDIGILKDTLLKGRLMNSGKLYGSKPPARDTLWAAIEKGGMEVKIFQKNVKNKEKEVDGQLITDATRFVDKKYYRDHKSGTIIIVAGDRDYCGLVENIMDIGWNVEMAAFKSSMSSSLQELEKSSKLLELKYLDDMFQMEPCWYYCSRKFNPVKANGERNLMPQESTMILKFADTFDTIGDSEKLVMLTNKLTKILRIPCRFSFESEPTNNTRHHDEIAVPPLSPSRYLFLIGLVRTSQRRSIDQNQVANENYVAFHDLCKKNREAIFTACKETVCELKELISMHEYTNKLPAARKTKTENKFAPLSQLVKDDDDDNENYDYDSELACKEEDDDDDHVVGDKVRKQKPKKKKAPTEWCSYGFNCRDIPRCKSSHTEDEIQFHERKGTVKAYKSKPCIEFTIRHTCVEGDTLNPLMCTDYHSIYEARCYSCNPRAGCKGHAASTCPKTHRTSANTCDDTVVSKERCVYKFTCKFGSGCQNKHSVAETTFFSKHNGKGAPGYKSQPCAHFKKRTQRKEGCPFGNVDKAPNCAYHHSASEAICYCHGDKGGHCGSKCRAYSRYRVSPN